MTKKIFKSTVLASAAVLILGVAFVMGILYQYFGKQLNSELEKEVASEMGITIGNLRVKMTRTKKWLCQHFADKARERGFL